VDGNESESEPEAASPPASSVPTAGVSAFKDIPLSKETTKLAQKMVEVAQSKAKPKKKTKLKKAKPKAEPKKTKPKRGTVRKIAAAVKTAEPTKTAEPEFADDYDGITWKPKDGGCEGRTDGVNGAWAIIPTIESDRYFVAFHPHGVMSIEDRKEIGTFPTIEEAQAACEADRVATS
jgi:hypothetical protein